MSPRRASARPGRLAAGWRAPARERPPREQGWQPPPPRAAAPPASGVLELRGERGERVVRQRPLLGRAVRALVAREPRAGVAPLLVAEAARAAVLARTAAVLARPAVGPGLAGGALRPRLVRLGARCLGGLGGALGRLSLGLRSRARLGPALLLLRAVPLLLTARGLPGALARHVDHRGHELRGRALLLGLDGGELAAPDRLLVDVVRGRPAPRAALPGHQVEPGVHAAVELVDVVREQRLERHRQLGRAELEPAVVREDRCAPRGARDRAGRPTRRALSWIHCAVMTRWPTRRPSSVYSTFRSPESSRILPRSWKKAPATSRSRSTCG